MIFPPRSTSTTGVPSSGRSQGRCACPLCKRVGAAGATRYPARVGHAGSCSSRCISQACSYGTSPARIHVQFAHRVDATRRPGCPQTVQGVRAVSYVHHCSRRTEGKWLDRPVTVESGTLLRRSGGAHDQPAGARRDRIGRGAEAARGEAGGGMGHRRAGRLLAVVRLAGGSFQGKLTEVQKNDNSAYLPASAESTKVDKASRAVPDRAIDPGFIVYQRDGGLTAADKAKIAADAQTFKPSRASRPTRWRRRSTRQERHDRHDLRPADRQGRRRQCPGHDLVNAEKSVIKAAKADAPAGLVVHSAGPGGLLVAFIDSFGGLDGTLLWRPASSSSSSCWSSTAARCCGSSRCSAPVALSAARRSSSTSRQARTCHPQRPEPGHPVGARHRRGHRLRPAADQPISRGAARTTNSRIDAMIAAWRGAAPAIAAPRRHRHPRPAVPDLRAS